MLQSSDDDIIHFASSNAHKYQEVKQILGGFDIKTTFLECDLEEIQSDSLVKVACSKARQAFDTFGKPLVVEDAGLFIDALHGFPGVYSSYTFKTIGNKGILNLLVDSDNRKADFAAAVVYVDSTEKEHVFEAIVHGAISESQRSGNDKNKGWGYDPIFIPSDTPNGSMTFAEVDKHIKCAISHRYIAFSKFAQWYNTRL